MGIMVYSLLWVMPGFYIISRMVLICWALEYHTLILFLKGTIMKYKLILFSPWSLKSPVCVASFGFRGC